MLPKLTEFLLFDGSSRVLDMALSQTILSAYRHSDTKLRGLDDECFQCQV